MLISDVIAGAGPKEADPRSSTLGQTDFLRMLIAQLENQDPLNPQESTEFSSQLAQFSSLEQAVAMRASLQEISSALNRGETGTAIGLIGRDILAESDQFELRSGGQTLSFELAGATDSTELQIRNANGALVFATDLGAQAAGLSEFSWNGADMAGNPLRDGVYSFQIAGFSDLQEVSVTPLISGRVSGADVSGDNPSLRVGGVVIPLSGVREVRAAAGVTP